MSNLDPVTVNDKVSSDIMSVHDSTPIRVQTAEIVKADPNEKSTKGSIRTRLFTKVARFVRAVQVDRPHKARLMVISLTNLHNHMPLC